MYDLIHIVTLILSCISIFLIILKLLVQDFKKIFQKCENIPIFYLLIFIILHSVSYIIPFSNEAQTLSKIFGIIHLCAMIVIFTYIPVTASFALSSLFAHCCFAFFTFIPYVQIAIWILFICLLGDFSNIGNNWYRINNFTIAIWIVFTIFIIFFLISYYMIPDMYSGTLLDNRKDYGEEYDEKWIKDCENTMNKFFIALIFLIVNMIFYFIASKGSSSFIHGFYPILDCVSIVIFILLAVYKNEDFTNLFGCNLLPKDELTEEQERIKIISLVM